MAFLTSEIISSDTCVLHHFQLQDKYAVCQKIDQPKPYLRQLKFGSEG